MAKEKPSGLSRMLGFGRDKVSAARPAAATLNGHCVLASGQSVTAGEWRAGETLLDDFLVEGLLGEGGMGKVYLVRSRSSRQAFAVKRARALDDLARRNFLAELQTWIDLPDHPNLVPCRFFRSLSDEILIFAEYVEGGSLSQWIQGRKLYEGVPKVALERILDVAIQFAWGLHCLHELGLVHQDVKPGNVLMAGGHGAAMQDVGAKVTDYGLARAKAAHGERRAVELGQSILVSSGGLTPAYCSPEQAKGLAVTRKTDVWSWGVSVLEMFTGEATWASGEVAAEALDQYLRERKNDGLIPEMPVGVAEVLRGCFQGEPARRWESLAEVVDRLRAVWRKTADLDYGRDLDPIERGAGPRTGIMERTASGGGSWTDPRRWLELALRAEGRNPAEAEAIVSKHGGSRRGELVADLAIYDQARRAYERLVSAGHTAMEPDLAALCMEKALVHRTADDMPGALREYDRAIEILVRLVHQEWRGEAANELAKAYLNKGAAVSALGDHQAAAGLYDRGIEILERLDQKEGRGHLANELLAAAYMNRGIAAGILGDYRVAARLCDRAAEIFERLIKQERRRELADLLAKAHLNEALALAGLGDHRAAIGLNDRAITIYERLTQQEGRREFAAGLAMTYIKKGDVVKGLGDHRAAMALFDQGIAIYERLVQQERWRELANSLAMSYTNKAHVVAALGDKRAAAGLFDRVIAIYERMVHREGREVLANNLATAYMDKANAQYALVDDRAAVRLYDQAITIYERLVQQEGRGELASDLALAYLNKGIVVALGDRRAAAGLCDRAIEIYERLIKQEGRPELANNLATAYMNKAISVGVLGSHRMAVGLCGRAIESWERLVHHEGRPELAEYLASAKAFRACTLIDLGEVANAVKEGHEAAEALRAEVART